MRLLTVLYQCFLVAVEEAKGSHERAKVFTVSVFTTMFLFFTVVGAFAATYILFIPSALISICLYYYWKSHYGEQFRFLHFVNMGNAVAKCPPTNKRKLLKLLRKFHIVKSRAKLATINTSSFFYDGNKIGFFVMNYDGDFVFEYQRGGFPDADNIIKMKLIEASMEMFDSHQKKTGITFDK